MKNRLILPVAGCLFLLFGVPAASAALAWKIGTVDGSNSEFALAPGNYQSLREDGFFIVGESDPKKDWPYVQPGPIDSWAGSRQHTFSVLFGLKNPPAEGNCTLHLDFLDTQYDQAPRLRVEINGTPFEKKLQVGAGDASINGEPSKGKKSNWNVRFPAKLLRAGANEIAIRTLNGSWVLYDALSLDVPGAAEIAPIEKRTWISSIDTQPVWVKDGDKAVQPVTINVRHLGTAGKLAVRIGDGAPIEVTLKRGAQAIELKAPALEQTREETVRVLDGGVELASAKVKLGPPPIREMWVLPHSHVDIGYTHRQDEIKLVQISNLLTGIRLARESAGNPPGMRFKWNPEAVWSLDNFLQTATPELKQEFIDAVRRGDVGVDGLYANLLTGLCRPEELAQGLSFAARLSNLTGVPVESASICDVPGYTWGMVPIMASAGVKYFAIGPNFRDRVGTIHVWDNKPFYWKSQSGRERVMCWVVDNYHFVDDLDSNVKAQISELGKTGFPYDMSFMFWVGRGPRGSVDNAPPDEETARKVVAWNKKYAAPRVVIGLVGEYFRTFERKYGSKVPEFSGDLTPYWEDGAGSTSRETALNRASGDRLSEAETVLAMRSGASASTAAFDQAWKNVLLYSEHTWGAYCSISKPDDAFTLDQWKVKQSFALDADRQSRELLNTALGSPKTAEFDVVNPTQWERTDLAVLPAGLDAGSVQDSDGHSVPFQQLSTGERVFLAKNVPPFASKRFRTSAKVSPVAQKNPATARGLVLDNGLVRVEVNPQTGAISSLRRAGSQTEYVDPKAPVALNDFRYVRGEDSAGAEKNGPATVTILENGPLVAALKIESDAPGCNKLVREVRLVAGSDRIELVNHVDRKSVREKDGVHFGFGFNLPQGKIRMETPWGVVRPDLDQLLGSCRNWFTVQRWVEVANDQAGMTWASLDAPLMEIGGLTANLLGSVAFEKWMTNALDSQTIYSWAQNNHWHTNYKIDQPGVTTFRFVLRPHDGGYSAENAARFGVETSRPLLVAAASGSVKPSLLRLSTDKVLVETVKPSSDGKATIIRLFGVSGVDQKVSLNWGAAGQVALFQTDLTEKPLKKLSQTVEVPAYAVVQLRVEGK